MGLEASHTLSQKPPRHFSRCDPSLEFLRFRKQGHGEHTAGCWQSKQKENPVTGLLNPPAPPAPQDEGHMKRNTAGEKMKEEN